MAQLNNERFETFKSQDQENGYFDLKFETEGKIIFAHKFMLAPVSDVFKRMISDIWNKNETIEIRTNSYNDFYEFLTFLYSGYCKLNDENIFTMVDLSEFYQVKELQIKCDEFLSKKKYTEENMLVFFENLSKYSLPLFEEVISKSMKKNGINLVESDEFLETSKSTVEKIVRLEDRFVSEEKLFEKIYEWAENRVKKKQSESNGEIYNLNEAIKAELIEILPFIRFKKMELDFLHKFVVKKGFLFSYDELSEILDTAFHVKVKITNEHVSSKSEPPSSITTTNYVKVKVTNEDKKSICGMLPCDSDFIGTIKSLKNRPCDSYGFRVIIWYEKINKITSIRSHIKKRDGAEWYLFRDNGVIGVSHYSIVGKDRDNLLAEMHPETSGFEITPNCKIKIE